MRELRQASNESMDFEMALIAVSSEGEVGAASTLTSWRDHVSGYVFDGECVCVCVNMRGR